MLNYINITTPDINNGLGCRMTIWISGCNHKCPGCHNPELWDYSIGSALLTQHTINRVAKELNTKTYILGITLSGGDPLMRPDNDINVLGMFLKELKSLVKRPFDIWIYSGDTYENLICNNEIKEVLNECDVLVDGPYMKDLRDITLPFRGSKNQRIVDLVETRKTGKFTELDIYAKNN